MEKGAAAKRYERFKARRRGEVLVGRSVAFQTPPNHIAFGQSRSNADKMIDCKSFERASREKRGAAFSQRALEPERDVA